MVELVLAGLLLSVSVGVGMAVLRLFKLQYDRWNYLGIGAALGLGILSYAVMVLGLMGWFYPCAMWGLLGVLLLPAVYGIRSFFKLRSPKLSILGKWEWLGLGLLFWCFFFNIFMALAPVFSADNLKYHLNLPKWYLQLHQIQFAPVFPFNMPQNPEMLFTAGMLLHSDTVGLLLHYALGPLAALGLWALAREYLSSRTAIWAAVFFYVGLPYIPHAAQGVDLAVIFLTVWAFYAFIRWRNTKQTGWLCLAGALAGLCAGSKYTGIYTPFALFFCVTIALVSDRRRSNSHDGRVLFTLGLFVLCGCLWGFPWYLKNWIVTGNPIYPIFYPLLGGKGWNLASYQEGINRLGTDMGLLGRGFFDLLTSPIKLLWIQNKIFIRGGVGLLVFCPVPTFFLLGKKFWRPYGWWIIFSIPFCTAWFVFAQHGRFLLPLIALWSVPCVATTAHLLREKGYLRAITGLILLLGVGMGSALAPIYASRFIPVVLGLEAREDFLEETTGFYKDIQWMNANLPVEAKVMTGFVNLYYLERPAIWMHARNAAWIDYTQVETEEDVLSQGLVYGITHIFVQGEPGLSEWGELVSKGLLERIYYNPRGRTPLSISYGASLELPVAIYRIKLTRSDDVKHANTTILPSNRLSGIK
jgi:hypothetical protein